MDSDLQVLTHCLIFLMVPKPKKWNRLQFSTVSVSFFHSPVTTASVAYVTVLFLCFGNVSSVGHYQI